MVDSKQVKKTNMTQVAFRNSVASLMTHRPPPKIKLAIALSVENLEYGDQVDFFAQLNEVCAEFGVVVITTIRGEWADSEDSGQLELYAPPAETLMGEIDKILGDDRPEPSGEDA